MTDWVTFPDGRARFGGSVRGWDERGFDTFGVDFDGRELYGEVQSAFSGNTMYLEIRNFGYRPESNVGMPGAAERFTPEQARRVESLVRELVVTVDGYDHDDKPFPMRAFGGAVFTGDVVFVDGWIELERG